MNKKIETSLRTKGGRRNFINCLAAVAIALIFLFPIYWLLAMSLKTDAESFGKVVTYYPHRFTLDPWIQNFSDKDFIQSLKNSCLIAVLSMILSIGLEVATAYGMGRYHVPGSRAFLLAFLVMQMLPASLMLNPMYLIFNKIGLLGTYLGPALAISSGSIPFIVVTLRPYFKNIPVALDDAARIDGCGVIRSFISIMLPAIKTGVITVTVISFMNGWNDLVYSMTFNVKPEMRPLTANIYKFQNKFGTKWNCYEALHYRYDAERLIIEPWGENSLRIRSSKMPAMPQECWALQPIGKVDTQIIIGEFSAEIVNGKIRAVINNIGKLFFYNQKGDLLLEEFVRNREDMFADTCSSLTIEAREFKPIIGGDYSLSMRFVSNPGERLYGCLLTGG